MARPEPGTLTGERRRLETKQALRRQAIRFGSENGITRLGSQR